MVVAAAVAVVVGGAVRRRSPRLLLAVAVVGAASRLVEGEEPLLRELRKRGRSAAQTGVVSGARSDVPMRARLVAQVARQLGGDGGRHGGHRRSVRAK